MAAAIYLGGAIGIELLGGYYAELYGDKNFTYSMIQTVEETLEIAGILFLIDALLKKLTQNFKEVRLILSDS